MLIIRIVLHDMLLDNPSMLLVYTIFVHTRFENLKVFSFQGRQGNNRIHQKTTG